MELIFSLTREDYRRFCNLVYARIASPSKGPLGLKGPLFPLASVVLTLLVLDYLYRTHVIDDRAFVAACLGYVWAVLSSLLLVWCLVRSEEARVGKGCRC